VGTLALRSAAIPDAGRYALLALAYFAAAKLSLVFAIPPGYATAVWLPSGLAAAAVVSWGARCWPGIWAGAALANFSVNLSIPAAIGIATGNTLEALCAGYLAAGLLGRGEGFRRAEGVFLFAAIAAAASAIAATAGAAAMVLAGAIGAAAVTAQWYTWWLGDVTGILVVTPCVLAWAHPAEPAPRRRPRYEIAVFALLYGGTLLAIFARPVDGATRTIALLAFPFLAWAACRWSERAVTASVLGAIALAVGCTVQGRGPFAGEPLNESLLSLQAFAGTAALIALALGAFVRERERALRLLRASHDALDAALRGRHAALGAREHAFAQAQALAHVGEWSWDSRSDRMVWSDELCRICGLAPGGFTGSFSDFLVRVDARDRERVRVLLHGALFAGRPWEAMLRIARPDGSVRVLHSFCRVPARRAGEPARLHGFCLDVTDRVRLEQIQAAQYEIALMLARVPREADALDAALRILREKLEYPARYWPGRPGPQAPALVARAWREQRALFDDGFAFPLVGGASALGVIELVCGARTQPDEALHELGSAAGVLLGEFIVRRRAEDQASASEVRLRTLSRRLLDAQDAERRTVAAELRDAVVRPLAAARADPGAGYLEAPLAAARELAAQLRPDALADYGLLAALRAYAARFERRTRIPVAVIGAEDAEPLHPRVESVLFQIARDALDNTARHARARSAAIELEITRGAVALTIRDDGCGFAVDADRAAGRCGIELMRARAASIGARLRIDSSPGQGTRVAVRAR
jgi:signal transduction histidine kinase/integral membrane sensor domain MASE1